MTFKEVYEKNTGKKSNWVRNARWRQKNAWWRNPLNKLAMHSPVWLCRIISKLTAAPK